MKRFIQDKVALLFVPACVLLSAPAFGQSGECSTDDDCAEGQLCQKGMSVGGCSGTSTPSPDGTTTDGPVPGDSADAPECDSEPQVSDTGFCYTPPTQCESDADCGEYLSCVESTDSDCAVSSDGETTCPEPADDAPKYCSIASVACETDADCPREFECVELEVCLLIACEEGNENCPDPCAPSGEKQCQAKQIACEETADCPSAWSCVGNVMETCTGSGTTDPGVPSGAGETSQPAPADGTEPMAPEKTSEEVTCTTEAVIGSCRPDAYDAGGVYYPADLGTDDADSGATSNPNTVSAESEDSPRAGGGCSVAQGKQPMDVAWVLGLLAALPLVRRRRSVA
jgi:MYXO-CTERM domain-containing protein